MVKMSWSLKQGNFTYLYYIGLFEKHRSDGPTQLNLVLFGADRDSFKDVNALHLANERFSPVRRASDGLAISGKNQVNT